MPGHEASGLQTKQAGYGDTTPTLIFRLKPPFKIMKSEYSSFSKFNATPISLYPSPPMFAKHGKLATGIENILF